MEKEKYICPVCGYDGLEEPAYDETGEPSFEVCSCCGFEFGFDDFVEHKTFKQYRNEWIKNGAKWENEKEKPDFWDLHIQLKNIKSKKRLFEDKVVDFFVSRIEGVEEFVKNTFLYNDETESVGMYIVLPDIICYLTSCVKKGDFVKVKEFFNVYNVFYEEFADEYQNLATSDEYGDLKNIVSLDTSDEASIKNYEFVKNALKNETMYNLNAVELFEILDTYEESERNKIFPFMSEKLQKEYKDINKNL